MGCCCGIILLCETGSCCIFNCFKCFILKWLCVALYIELLPLFVTFTYWRSLFYWYTRNCCKRGLMWKSLPLWLQILLLMLSISSSPSKISSVNLNVSWWYLNITDKNHYEMRLNVHCSIWVWSLWFSHSST